MREKQTSFLIFSTESMVINGFKNVLLVKKIVKNILIMLKKFGL
ncbi:MAG: hypothetical protein ACFFAN_00720 [Promethearchaeota archaeon]